MVLFILKRDHSIHPTSNDRNSSTSAPLLQENLPQFLYFPSIHMGPTHPTLSQVSRHQYNCWLLILDCLSVEMLYSLYINFYLKNLHDPPSINYINHRTALVLKGTFFPVLFSFFPVISCNKSRFLIFYIPVEAYRRAPLRYISLRGLRENERSPNG